MPAKQPVDEHIKQHFQISLFFLHTFLEACSRADGSVDPLTAPIFTVDDETHVLADNVAVIDADGVKVERDNVVVDGASYSIQGAETWSGMMAPQQTSLT